MRINCAYNTTMSGFVVKVYEYTYIRTWMDYCECEGGRGRGKKGGGILRSNDAENQFHPTNSVHYSLKCLRVFSHLSLNFSENLKK